MLWSPLPCSCDPFPGLTARSASPPSRWPPHLRVPPPSLPPTHTPSSLCRSVGGKNNIKIKNVLQYQSVQIEDFSQVKMEVSLWIAKIVRFFLFFELKCTATVFILYSLNLNRWKSKRQIKERRRWGATLAASDARLSRKPSFHRFFFCSCDFFLQRVPVILLWTAQLFRSDCLESVASFKKKINTILHIIRTFKLAFCFSVGCVTLTLFTAWMDSVCSGGGARGF